MGRTSLGQPAWKAATGKINQTQRQRRAALTRSAIEANAKESVEVRLIEASRGARRAAW